NCIGRERHFRYVELPMVEHAPESLARAQREECQVYAFGLHPSVDQRLGAIITATGEGQLELMHGARTRLGTFSCRDHLPGIGTTCAVRRRRPLLFSAAALTPGASADHERARWQRSRLLRCRTSHRALVGVDDLTPGGEPHALALLHVS